MASAKERLIEWLSDAHAMEMQAETMLKGQASRIEHYPQLKARIEQHVTETQNQAKRVASCIDKLGGNPSTIKDLGGKSAAIMQAIGGSITGDEVVKGAMASYAFEHFEIASYKILIAAADACGETEVAKVCAEILPEEEAMAAWLAEHLHDTTKQYLEREEFDAKAKR